MIEGTQPATSRPPFSAASSPEKRAVGGPSAPEGGLSAGAGIGGVKWLADPHNVTTSWGPEGLSQEILEVRL